MTIIYNSNPKREKIELSDEKLIELCKESSANFPQLPLYHLGESKEIRRTSVKGLLIQKLIPSLNSITEKRKGIIENTEIIREEISSIFWEELHKNKIPTCYLAKKNEFVLMIEEKIPPIEIIVKAAIVGTPTKIYYGFFNHTDRFGKKIVNNELHKPYIRFDYRNPLQNEKGELLRDECMPLYLADRFIHTEVAEKNGLRIFDIVQNKLNKIGLQVLDCCYFLDDSGEVLCCEISPDNMRIKAIDWSTNKELTSDFDKDLWRKKADDKFLKKQWGSLLAKLEKLDQDRDRLEK